MLVTWSHGEIRTYNAPKIDVNAEGLAIRENN